MVKRTRKRCLGGKPSASVAIMPLGTVSKDDVDFAAQTIHDLFGVRVCVLPRHDLESRYYYSMTGQYNVDDIINKLLFRWFVGHRATRVIGLTDADLYASGRAYVFGYAHLVDGVLICSTYRLMGSSIDMALRRERLLKILVHEFAHTFDLVHCKKRYCALFVVEYLSDLDKLNRELCDDCRAKVDSGLRFGYSSAEYHHARGLGLLRRGEEMLHMAENEFRIAIQISPDEAKYRNDLGVVLMKCGRISEALIEFFEATRCSGLIESWKPYYNIGLLGLGFGDFEMADKYFLMGLELYPDKERGLEDIDKTCGFQFRSYVLSLREKVMRSDIWLRTAAAGK